MPNPRMTGLDEALIVAFDAWVMSVEARLYALEHVTPPEPEPPDPTPPPDDVVTLCVRIDYQGASYVYDEVLGTDLGDYREPGGHFTQRCVLCSLPDLPGFSVQFRRDADGSRDEVVFELGAMWDTAGQANMDGYVATIMRGSTTLAVVQAPAHYWRARWRWQSKPRPIIYPGGAYLDNLLPAYSETLYGATIPLSEQRSYAGPMDLAGITPYIPSTGERDEIGPVTEGQAEYLCTVSDTAWASVQAWLEASGSIPLHFRDEDTHAPLDWTAYPNATMYSPSGANPYVQNPPSPITLDVAHMGSFAYVPFLLTGDPYALEWMQFVCVYNVIMLSPGARQNFNLGNSVRALAWTLRALAQAATVTPDEVPSWLLPRGLFKQRLDDERDWFMDKYVNGTTQPCTALNILSTPANSQASAPYPAGTWANVWMEDYLSMVIGWIVQMGHSDWLPVLEWKSQDTQARTNSQSGWIRAVPTVYMTALAPDTGADVATSWADAWWCTQQINPDACSYDDPDQFPASLDLTYPSYTLGALAMAARAGVDGAQACYDWILSEMQRSTTSSRYSRRKWAIASPAGW